MREFIKVEIDLSKCAGRKEVAEWVQVCPVNIFTMALAPPTPPASATAFMLNLYLDSTYDLTHYLKVNYSERGERDHPLI